MDVYSKGTIIFSNTSTEFTAFYSFPQGAKAETRREKKHNAAKMLLFLYLTALIMQGHDTTAASMNWVLHLLGSHPEAHSKVQQELQEVFGNTNMPALPSHTHTFPLS